MIQISLSEITKDNISIKDLTVRGIDEVNPKSLPSDVCSEDFYSFIHRTHCIESLSSAIIDVTTTQILGLLLISNRKINGMQPNERGRSFIGCGIAKNMSNELSEFVIDQLISRTKSLFQLSRRDDNTPAIDYFCFQPNTEDECNEIKSEYGMTENRLEGCPVLSKRINNGVTIDLSFLKRYF